jgi:protein MpaA
VRGRRLGGRRGATARLRGPGAAWPRGVVAAARPRRAVAAGLGAALLGAGALALAQDAPPVPVPLAAERLGLSVEGRPISLLRVGDPAAPRRVLVVACVHGDECAGRAIVAELRRHPPAPGVQLLLVRTANPDGFVRASRRNARLVDLNRNSAQGWRRLRGPQASGRRPWSEPETRALRRLVLRERPALVVWYHQPLRLVDAPESGSAAAARRYARLVRLPFRPLPAYPGSLSRWVNARLPAATSFVVELPPGPLRSASTRRHARAVLALAAAG